MSPDALPSGSKGASVNEPFSDASSSYWSEGWNWARFSDPDANIMALPEDERTKMMSGLKEILGEEGVRRMHIYIRRKRERLEDKKLREQGVPPPKYDAPQFLKQWRKGYSNNTPWGFVAFRTVLYDDEEKWAQFKDRVHQILHLAFDKVVGHHRGHEYEEVAKARKWFTLHWVEDKGLDGATEETLREWYANAKTDAPTGMGYNMFLCTCAEAVESVFSNDFPTIDSFNWRDDAPFLLVVMEVTEVNPHDEEEHDPDDPHTERNWYKSVFKVPIEIVPDELWGEIDSEIFPHTRLTRNVKGCNQLLGGKVPNNTPNVDGLTELWWGMSASPKSIRRRHPYLFSV
ncbi:uncharacterized protein GIQ15_04819 [Arthroderma uncinatum]|uniref:uncharacterized protein n=1 Tax=Arthroderma uncinatum TaxID=74035 RepID=UPI00144A589E|nr:uncharacterized protein GIQ15_04819 [Arthroderma uncinatum]KAF3482060.1 hypothetical protein GIQ15_04819 [Arthroderma uncinatum]